MPLTMDGIKNKSITVGIIGLGYVGLPLALVFAESGIPVIGFDNNKKKVKDVDSGHSYLKHIDSARIKNAKESHKFKVTFEYSHIAECDAVIICVPTPLSHHLDPDLCYITETCASLAPYLKPYTLVSLESTTWPGTTEEVVKPILESKSSLKAGHDLYLCFSPEREDPGNKSYQTKNIPKLIGGFNKESLDLGVALYSLAVNQIVSVSSMQTAETAKLFENIFRNVNIALVNELKIICDFMHVDVWEVIQAAATKPFGFMPFWPGPGLGGHCIPIDPFYLSWKAREYGITTWFIELAGEINRAMPRHVTHKIQDCLNKKKKSLNGSRILILGVAYKPDIDDLRESPSLEIMRLLEAKGAEVDYHDPYIQEIGELHEKPYFKLIGKKNRPLSNQYDCFVLATDHAIFNKEEILSYGVPIVDTRNFFPKSDEIIKA